MPRPVSDLLVLGSGVAGLSAAVRARHAGLSVTVLTKGELGWSATRYAQGGVAAALDPDDDSPELHGSDTLTAGAGLCDADAVRVLASEGPDARARAHGARRALRRGRRPTASSRGPAKAGTRSPGSCTRAATPPAPRSSGRWSPRCSGSGAEVREGWLASDLLVEDGRVVGRPRDRARRRRRSCGAATW